MRKPMLVQVAPDRSTLYRIGADGRILNHFRIRVANRGSVPATVGLSAEGLPGASVTLPDISVQPGEEIQSEFDVQAPRVARDVNHFTFLVRVSPPQPAPPLPMTFIGVGPR
jgi:hypothetical protein